MIGKVLRGERPAGLIRYLYGPGRHEEHTDPHLVAGWRHPAELEPPLLPDGRRDLRRLNGLLQQTITAAGARAPGRPVWHCAVRAAPGDRMLSDDEWAHVACEIMHRTGLSPYGSEDDGVRWVAIRHGDDHIHIVATLARQDGGRARVSNDFYRVREACLAAEARFGLRATAPGDRTAGARPTRAENEKARRRGWREAPRVTLRRKVSVAAAGAGSEAEFFDRLRRAGVRVRARYSARDPGQVTGYAVGLVGDLASGGEPVWYGGGKLAPDLTLPKLRRRWAGTAGGAGIRAGGQLTARERAAIWDHATRAAGDAAGRIRELAAAGDVAGAADAAWAAGGTLHAAAAALGSREVRQAASAYDRAARMPYGRIPAPTQAGNDLRRAARLLSAAAFTSRDRTLRQAALIARLAALAEAVTELRQVQAHAAQAAAARSAAERLHAAASGAGKLFAPRQGLYEDAADLAREAFPDRPRPGSFVRAADGRRDPDDQVTAARRGPERTSRSRNPGR